jgi:flagellar biosynthesis protein FlhB
VLIGATVAFMAWQQIDKVIAVGFRSKSDRRSRPSGTSCCAARSWPLTVILVIGLIDFFFQRRQHDKEMRMTKQEVREEVRMSTVTRRSKPASAALQREIAAQRMMSDVPKATVVITNPTHFAVALMYDRDATTAEKRGAPRVVAKGVDHVAQTIKESRARSRRDRLRGRAAGARAARALRNRRRVPAELYQAVAEVLAYVYGLQEERPFARA